jgi:Leucine-rich repeat (LRR) protein
MGNFFETNEANYDIEFTLTTASKKKTLNLSNLNLTEINQGLIEKLIERNILLETILLYGNNLKKINTEIFKKNESSLKELDISHNLLKEIPEEIGNCKTLNRLCLSGNLLESIPDELIIFFY